MNVYLVIKEDILIGNYLVWLMICILVEIEFEFFYNWFNERVKKKFYLFWVDVFELLVNIG